jgi:hypothetical protein
MDLNQITIQPADPGRDFAAIAAMMNTVDTEPNTADTLVEWYRKQPEAGIRFATALAPDGKMVGFNGIYRAYTNLERNYDIYLIIGDEFRRQVNLMPSP